MKCFCFYIYADQDGDIVPSEVFEAEIEKDVVNLKEMSDNLIYTVAFPHDKKIWFYSSSKENVRAYLLGMSFAVTNLMDKTYEELFHV